MVKFWICLVFAIGFVAACDRQSQYDEYRENVSIYGASHVFPESGPEGGCLPTQDQLYDPDFVYDASIWYAEYCPDELARILTEATAVNEENAELIPLLGGILEE